MIDTTLIGVLAAAAVAVILLLLFLRRHYTPKFDLQDDEETSSPSALEADADAESLPEMSAREAAQRHVVEGPSGSSKATGQAPLGSAVAEPPPQPAPTPAENAEQEAPDENAAAASEDAIAAEDADRASAEARAEAAAAAKDAVDVDTAEDAESAAREESIGALKQGLKSTRGGFIARLAKLFKGKTQVDSALLDEFEEILITADVGVKTCDRLLGALKAKAGEASLESDNALWEALRAEAKQILHVDAAPIALKHQPSLILVTGVNGVGKTTTIGKLAAKYTAEGRRVLLAAGDTYRAAAVLQLEVWGQRVGCPVIKGKEGADPGSVIFDAITRAREERYDLVIADTAGRLHTKQPLMEELKKVDRTITKALGGRAADEILLVLDATTGQNAVQQMHMFRDTLSISGVVLTKLDGTAKGGVILGIVDEHKVPVRFVGLGERVEDLREFDADTFVAALFERPSGETLAA